MLWFTQTFTPILYRQHHRVFFKSQVCGNVGLFVSGNPVVGNLGLISLLDSHVTALKDCFSGNEIARTH